MSVVNGSDLGQRRQLLTVTQLLFPVLGTQVRPKYFPYRVRACFWDGKKNELL
jgi:hypothetical protein